MHFIHQDKILSGDKCDFDSESLTFKLNSCNSFIFVVIFH